MKTIQIKVENDSTIELLKNIKGVTIKEPTEEPETEKGWWDAFLEHYKGKGYFLSIEYQKYSTADCIKVNNNGKCDLLRPLMQYVLKFTDGGFWFNSSGLFFVTQGSGSHEYATYESAKEFLLGNA